MASAATRPPERRLMPAAAGAVEQDIFASEGPPAGRSACWVPASGTLGRKNRWCRLGLRRRLFCPRPPAVRGRVPSAYLGSDEEAFCVYERG